MVKDRSAAGAAEFRAARDLLLEHRLDQPTAHQMFMQASAAGHGREDDAAVIKIFPGITLPGSSDPHTR